MHSSIPHPDRTLINANSHSSVIEAYRTIRTFLKYTSLESGHKVILITSAVAGEGKSTIAANLGLLFAQDQKKVLLIDGDLRRPHLHHLFDISGRNGLSSILAGYGSLEEGPIATKFLNLDLLPGGPIQSNPSELLGLSLMETLIANYRPLYDLILIDAPPLLSVSDAQQLTRVTDGIVLVVRAKRTKKEDIKKAQKLLEPFHSKVLGAILNK